MRLASIGRLVIDLGKHDKRLGRIGVGGPRWSARHVWWRLYWRVKP